MLEPIFEADFKPCSYGFRPNRRAQDAIAEIHHLGTSGYHWVFESDIQWQHEMGSFRQRANRRRHGKGNWKLVRYADDLVLMVSGDRQHAEALREEVSAVIEPLGLRLAPDKTRVAHIDEGFVFLGFTIRRLRKRGTQKYYVYTTPSRKAVQAIKGKVSEKTYRSTRYMDLDELIRSLNRTLAGWANHFRYGVSKTTFSAVDHHAWGRLI